jgi:hypothetical protein
MAAAGEKSTLAQALFKPAPVGNRMPQFLSDRLGELMHYGSS